MMKKYWTLFALLILLTSCQFNFRPVHRMSDFKDPKSDLIKALLTEQDISAISGDFAWKDIILTQNQTQDTDLSAAYENAQGAFFGDFHNSDQNVMLFHSLNRYDAPIDKNQPPKFLLSGYEYLSGAASYAPEISASGDVAAKCVEIALEAKRICDVHVRYQKIESDVNITTRNIDKEMVTGWLKAIVTSVEERIVALDQKP